MRCPYFLFPSLLGLLCGAGGLLGGCSAREKKSEQVVAVQTPRHIGEIKLVNDASKFVLIDHGQMPAPAEGVLLKARSGGADSAELRVTQVQRRPFVVADILSGEPKRGDAVVYLPVIVRRATVASPSPEALPALSEEPRLDH